LCQGCPVFNRTKKKRCVGTPYISVIASYKWTKNEIRMKRDPKIIDKELKKLRNNISDEIEFLKSLLPKED
jgi:hypothetical protein